jgi:5-methylcytosine-specific restriction endonuclease McrBC regulatory subunit McrC
MGFIGMNNTNIAITSRFADDENDNFLHYMLQKVLAINVFDWKHSGGKDDIWDFFIFLFPYFLNKALSQGLYKEYRHNECNDANVRGVIDVNRHLQINIPFSGKIAYSTREYSHNNPVTQIIRHTIEYIKTHEFGANVLTSDTDTLMNINQKKSVVHPYFTEYKTLQRLCLRILCKEKVSYNSDKEKIHGILFDGAWLWEEYLNTILVKNGFEHPNSKTQKGGQKLFVDSTETIYPDFIKEKPFPIIADAKYKSIEKYLSRSHGNDERNNQRGDNSDYYQLITYMYRFNSKRGYLLFPYSGEMVPKQKLMLRGFDNQSSDIEVILYGMKIPENISNYSTFKDKMKISEEKLTEIIENCKLEKVK